MNINELYLSEGLIDNNLVLSQVDQLAVWQEVLGFYPSVDRKQKFRSPFRDDKNPDCFIYEHNGIYHLFDKQYFDNGWTCIHAIRTHKQITYSQAIKYIYFNYLNRKVIKKESLPIIKTTFNHVLKAFPRIDQSGEILWSEKDKELWDIFEREAVERENIRPLDYYYTNAEKTPNKLFKFKAEAPSWYLTLGDKTKMRLYNNSERYMADFTGKEIGGNNEFKTSDVLILAKGVKEHLLCDHLLYSSRYLHNEGIHVFKELIELCDSFPIVFSLTDGDSAGIEYAKYLQSQVGSIPLYIEGYDPFDFVKENGYNYLAQLIKLKLNSHG